MTLIRDINNILEYGRKSISYKYATLLELFDFITEHPSEQPINNLHFIPNQKKSLVNRIFFQKKGSLSQIILI